MSESSLTPSADGPTRLIMMARVPVYGQVKSRLAKHVGKARALATHVELLNYNAVLAARSEMPFELHFVGDPRRPFFAQLAQSVGASLVEQVDPSEPFPPGVLRQPRSHTGGPRAVHLPEGWLEDRDNDQPPGAGADSIVSGG